MTAVPTASNTGIQPAPSKYQALFDRMDQGFCILQMLFDADDTAIDYRYLEVNRVFEQELGMAGALGRTVREIAPDIEPFWMEIYGRVALTGEGIVFENYSKPFARWFDVNAFRIGDPGARQVAVIFRDITERKRRESHQAFLADITEDFARIESVEEVMQAVGAKIGAYLDVTSCMFYEVDDAGDSIRSSFGWRQDGEPNLVRSYRISEYLSDDFAIANRANQPVAVADTQADPRTSARLYAALNVRAFLTIPHHQHGVWKYYVAVTDSRARHWREDEIALFQELAGRIFTRLERALAERALRESEARFRLMADAVPHIVWIIDADGRIEFLNRQWLIYTGTLAEQAPGAFAMIERVVHPADAETTRLAFERALRDGRPLQHEQRIRSAEGEYRWFLVRAEPHRDPETGALLRWFGASVDIHDRRLAEDGLAETDRRKDEFLATLAHELRNPLAPIRTGLAVLDREPPAAVAAHTRDVMGRQLAHMVRLIDDLLDIARINTDKIELKPEPVELAELLDGAIEASRPVIDGSEHQLSVALDPGPLRLRVDPTRITQVISNLLSNAAKYTPRGGRIEVSARRDGATAEIRVRDNGIGIAADALPVVFDLFSQVGKPVDRVQGGLGIGLALVRRLVEMHGGAVTAESDGPAQGSTFIVRLPLDDAGTARTPAPARVASVDPGAGRRVLVVDDNADAAETLGMLLGLLGHATRSAHSGSAAIEAAIAFEPQVVFLDIGLPDMDGYRVARKLREQPATRRATLVALTGWGAQHDVQRAMENGFDHHLTKPVDVARINEIFSRLASAAGGIPS